MTDKKPKLAGLHYGIKPANKQFDLRIGSADKRSHFAVDQAKFNFAWLNFPELESKGLSVLSDELVIHVHENMDKTTRSMLLGLPLSFMRYWVKMNMNPVTIPLLAVCLPEDYMGTMMQQARFAQDRLVKQDGNVVKVQFPLSGR